MLRRLLQLFIGLTLYGVSTAMFVRADLGADPWNVFHLGVANLLSMNVARHINRETLTAKIGSYQAF